MKTRKELKPVARIVSILVPLLLAATLLPAPRAQAAATPIPMNLKFQVVVEGLDRPLFVTHAGDDSSRLFIVEKTGRIRLFKNGSLSTFLDLSAIVNYSGGEQGLLGLAFAPDYSTSGEFYVVYIKKGSNTIALARYQVSADPDVANPNSQDELLTISKSETNHNGGMLAFGPDGYLYMSVGDGGGAGDPNGNAQNKNVLLGKILRLDVSGTDYSIPASNPFAGQANRRGEIWSLGLRNPWRFSFDSLTGDLYIGDVGQGAQEEVDFRPASSPGGENYGWDILEGRLCYPSGPCTPPAGYVPPVLVYNHGPDDSIGCSITGGYVYRGSGFPALQGVYLYGDFCTGRIWGAQNAGGDWSPVEIRDTDYMISSFGEDAQGELYLTDYLAGRVLRIVEAPIVTVRFSSIAAQDGSVAESAENSSTGGSFNAGEQSAPAGDLQSNRQTLGILSFNTRSLPDGAAILSAKLRFRVTRVVGLDPFSALAPLHVDIRKGFFGSSSALQPEDFQAAASRLRVAGAATSLPGGFYRLVLVRGAPYVKKDGLTQLRVYFALDDNNNSSADYARIASGDNPVPGDRPKLIIQYFIP